VIAAGTGLGEARLVWCGDRYLVLPTEGGHTDYAPRSPLEGELWQFLSKRFPDHVSYERVLSGAGLGAIYEFFVARCGSESPEVAAALAEGDRNARIAELGLAGKDDSARDAVDLFAFIYGAEAGNIALRELALGGVYVTGNIGHTILPSRREQFLEGFLRKGRFAGLLSTIPIAIVADPFVGLRGALALARELAAKPS
jgi:glucokinase